MMNRREFMSHGPNLIAMLMLLRPEEVLAKSGLHKLLRPSRSDRFSLASGLEAQILSRKGEMMSDGQSVPSDPDGMGVFKQDDSYTAIIRNHEIDGGEALILPGQVYDPRAAGGTVTLYLDQSYIKQKEFVSLAGTMRNCSGGPTPWATWLSCEEDTSTPRDSDVEKKHGYVFEVDPFHPEKTLAEPLVGLGRFNHEAARVGWPSGIVYLTEDQPNSVFYRFIPREIGKLRAGGELQVFCLESGDRESSSWGEELKGVYHSGVWKTLPEVDREKDDLRTLAHELGALEFVRGEGMTSRGEEIFFTANEGGPKNLGQIFHYQSHAKDQSRGELALVYVSTNKKILHQPDNITINRFGDIIICEDIDNASKNRLMGLTPEGKLYQIALSGKGEWTGVAMMPDGESVLVNIMDQGLTMIIKGDWSTVRSS